MFIIFLKTIPALEGATCNIRKIFDEGAPCQSLVSRHRGGL